MININSTKKNILQVIFLITLVVMTTYLVFNSLDINLLSQVIKIIDYKYIVLGFGLMILYIALEGHITNLIIKSISGSTKKSLGYKIGIIGLFYNLVTPMASGSQPMQIYELSKSKVPVSKGSAVVVNKTIVFQVTVTLYCAILMIFNIDILQTQLKSVFLFIVLGMVMNIIMLSFGFFIVYNPVITKNIVTNILNLLTRFKYLQFLDSKRKDIYNFIDEYNYSVKLFIKDRKTLNKSLFFTFIQLTVYFSVAYCISKALNLTGSSYLYILSLQVFLYMAVSSMPTPGNVGANEIAFFTIFAGVFPKTLLGYSVLLYGVFVYYFLLVCCGLFTILNQSKVKCKLNSYFVKLYKPSVNI